MFVDGGNAFDTLIEPFKVGAGVGIRWISPVGPVRLDFAWAVSEPDRPFRLHERSIFQRADAHAPWTRTRFYP